MHYDEAVLLQKLKKHPVVTYDVLVDEFIASFPYGALLFNMTREEYRQHVLKNINVVLDFVEPNGIKVKKLTFQVI